PARADPRRPPADGRGDRCDCPRRQVDRGELRLSAGDRQAARAALVSFVVRERGAAGGGLFLWGRLVGGATRGAPGGGGRGRLGRTARGRLGRTARSLPGLAAVRAQLFKGGA